MPFVGFAFSEPGVRERLAGTRARPDLPLLRPARESERVFPASNASEEMDPVEAVEIALFDIENRPFVYGRFREKILQPVGCERVEFVEKRGHSALIGD
jgi:hypothetical protein